MQSLTQYLYNKHLSSKDPNSKALSLGQPLKSFLLSPEQLQFYNSLLIRNMLAYSAATMEVRLSPKHLFSLYRLHKFEGVVREAGLAGLWEQWIANEMMPLAVPKSTKGLSHSFIIVDYQEEGKKQPQKPAESIDVAEEPAKKGKSKGKGKAKVADQPQPKLPQVSHQHSSDPNPKTLITFNITQLTTYLENQLLTKQTGIQPTELKQPQKRAEAIEKFKKIKVEQYIYERYGNDTLMTFNFISAYPFIEQKQLLNKTMLSAADLRKCLGKLITDGLVNFYPESPKVLLYRCISRQNLHNRFLDHIAQSILNLLIVLQSQDHEPAKRALLLHSVSRLDDVLAILMG